MNDVVTWDWFYVDKTRIKSEMRLMVNHNEEDVIARWPAESATASELISRAQALIMDIIGDRVTIERVRETNGFWE